MNVAAEIIARLRTVPDTFAIVEGAGEFAAIDGVPTAMPAAYVIVEDEIAGDNERMTGPVLQRCEADIAVVIITDNVSDAVGGAATSDIEGLKQKVRKALLGFVPPSSSSGDPVIYVEGKALKLRGGTAWYRELFAVAYYLEEEA